MIPLLLFVQTATLTGFTSLRWLGPRKDRPAWTSGKWNDQVKQGMLKETMVATAT
jgi:hypothetical protein